MSDDLISRKALLEELESFSMRISGSTKAMALMIVEECKKSFARMIDEQPVVYDLDKVLEQLKENSFVLGGWIGVSDVKVIKAEKALGIARSGGMGK